MDRLLAELKALEPAPLWLRLLYLQPDGIDDALLQAMAGHAVPYIDVPLQHASGAVLRRMRRSGDGEAFLALLDRVRAVLPGAAVRSTFIAGFPGETDEEFEELVSFVRAAGLAAAGVFVYDAQQGTAGAELPGQIPAALAFERAARLGEVIDETAAALLAGPSRPPRSTCSSSAARRPPERRGRRPPRPAGAGRRRPGSAQRPGSAARAGRPLRRRRGSRV